MTINKREIPQQKLGTVMRSFFDHVTSHDEEGVHAALCMVANAGPSEHDKSAQMNSDKGTESMHICGFNAGDPDILVQMIFMAIDSMLEEIPGFTKAWESGLRAKQLQFALKEVLNEAQQAAEAKGMEAAKPEADALIKKLTSNPNLKK